MISHLPRDLEEEVFSRLPLTSLRGFRSSCKNWNTLSKDRSFTKKHLARAKAAAGSEFMAVMVMQFRVYLISVNLHGVHEGVDPSINHQGKLVSLKYSDRVDISRVYHCDGLVLCITKDYTRFVVWNPYLGQTLKVTSPHPILDCYNYAIGYEKRKSHRNYKVLRFVDSGRGGFVEYKIYEFNSNSWRVLDVTCYWYIAPDARGVSIKGNTYWFARHKSVRITHEAIYFLTFLICFDFTSERFGPPLPMPFRSCVEDTLTLSSVREEQLAVLFQRSDTLYMEIWITTKIEPKTVLWSKVFLAVDMKPLSGFQFLFTFGSFLIDEEKKVVVVFDKDIDVMNTTRNIAYIIGEDGYFKEVDLGESTDKFRCPVVCSYVPSSVRIKKGGKRKKRT
ncbi:putative F-box protein [Cardamine amara subsp. amara]|uniref:F-box protein n=1 Tax=Cardamine amara subsp. amara TaxID=228776 RepID=A0ABD1A7A2_CARAN